jgi:hypothetical protein
MLQVEKYAPIYIRFPQTVFIQKEFRLTAREKGKEKRAEGKRARV